MMFAKSTFFIVSSMSNHLRYQYEVGAVKDTSYFVDWPAIAFFSSFKKVVKLTPSSGWPPRSGAPGYSCEMGLSYEHTVSHRFKEEKSHPIKIHAVETIVIHECEKIVDKLFPIRSRRDHRTEYRLCRCSIVIESPASE